MAAYRLISADSHIVEPPDLYTSRVQPKFRDRAPRMQRQKTPSGSEYDAWFIDNMQVGTLGAVIRLRGPVRDRRALFDMAVAGPLAGLLVAVPIYALGLHLSAIQPVPPDFSGVQFGDAVLPKLIERLVLGPLPPGHDIFLHPVGVAGWFGFFVTALNLIPAGQLDGGHIVYALSGRRHALTSQLAVGALPGGRTSSCRPGMATAR